MAPGPLVSPSLNGQKRDSKRGKPRRDASLRPCPGPGLSTSYLTVGTLPLIVCTSRTAARANVSWAYGP